jgi:peptidoglycan/xylan/chitin deacetylase (PgdA/CDA1 family)
MKLWKRLALSAYYAATQPARRRAAVDRAARQTEPIRVLFYHRVANRYPNNWTMPTATFAAQLRWMLERFDLVSLSEAQARIAAGRNRWPTACITFDDGYAENLSFAIPLLLKHRVPFTYFVSTDHVLRGDAFPHDVESGQALPPNTAYQLRELATAGVEIGAHTRSHADLGSGVSRQQLVEEVAGSKCELEAALDCEINYFSFPFGLPESLSHEAFRVALAAGFRGVCSAYGGYNFPGDDPFHLRRFHADAEMVRFKNWLTIDPRKLRQPIEFDPGEYRAAASAAAPPPVVV